MKKQYKISAIIIGAILLLASLIAICSNVVEIEVKTSNPITQLALNAQATNGSIKGETLTTGQIHNSNSSYLYECVNMNTNPNAYNKTGIPKELYCLQHGTHFEWKSSSIKDIREYNGKRGTTTTSATGAHARTLSTEDKYSNTYYICSGSENHNRLSANGAYIITQPDNILAPSGGKYTFGNYKSSFVQGENISAEVRQIAIWMSDLNRGAKVGDSEFEEFYEIPSMLNTEADSYKRYEEILNENINDVIKNTGNDEVKTTVDQKDQYIFVGPYKMDYIDGKADSVAFSGISNITVKGYNDKDKRVEIKDLKIVGFKEDGVEKELKFFAPTKEEGYVDRLKKLGEDTNIKELSYPSSGKEFYLKIENPNKGITEASKRVNYYKIEVEYKYMTSTGEKCELQAMQEHAHKSVTKTDEKDGTNKEGDLTCTKYWSYSWKVKSDPKTEHQDMMKAWGERNIYKKTIELSGKIETTGIPMSLGGYVWEDVPYKKEDVADGRRHIPEINGETKDKAIPYTKVTLYECPLDSNGKLQYKDGQLVSHVADLLSTADKAELTEEEQKRRINPTLTNSDGYYQFDGLNPSNKYYVEFEYNGQVYLPTDYLVKEDSTNENLQQYKSVSDMVSDNAYNTENWRVTSKAVDIKNDRENYNKQFEEIGSSPYNYISTNSLGLSTDYILRKDNKYYNETFSQYELMGFELDKDRDYKDYKQTGLNLIDGFYEIGTSGEEKGKIVETNTIRKGIITERIEKYINDNKKYPNENELKVIYQEIAGNNVEIWRKLQFIEDCKMKAYTISPNDGKLDLYPVYDEFAIDNIPVTIPGEGTFAPIYDGQFFVNLGLWRRQQVDMSLEKDIAYAATRINGKTEVYEYDNRLQSKIPEAEYNRLVELKIAYNKDKDNEAKANAYNNYLEELKNKYNYWEIQLRMRDYEKYYDSTYSSPLYKADYNYRKTNLHPGEELDLYVTYRITIRNNSESVLNKVEEVVDYYDKDYTYIEDLSWVMYKNDSNSKDSREITLTKDEYYNSLDTLTLPRNAKPINSKNTSTYGKESQQSGMEREYNSVYVQGLENKKLASGEEAYIYLTFRVNKNSNGAIITDNNDSLKQNYAEINGYSTYYSNSTKYYSNGTKLPNGQTTNSSQTAGLIDINSDPGNLTLNDTKGDRAEKNFENDTDRAKSIKVTVEDDYIRSVNGYVWDDTRTKTVSNATIGDGVRKIDNKKEFGIKGVTVELVEKLSDSTEYVWQTTQTDSNGKYEFKLNDTQGNLPYIIPGNYFVRFQYGHNDETVQVNENSKKSYNGQDFKSTVYQKDMNGGEIAGYNNEYYNIEAADRFGKNLSDAKDLWETKTVKTLIRREQNGNSYQEKKLTNVAYQGRETVNNYSKNGVTNHVAEVLASPYINKNNSVYINELKDKTYMTAETGIIVLDGEYDRITTSGTGGNTNGIYTLSNLDLGLTERPKAQLELTKKVTGVKVILANGATLVDATPKNTAGTATWENIKEYKLNEEKNNKTNIYSESYTYRLNVNTNFDETNKYNGLVSIIMDEELMHGASIGIVYDLTVTNVGETDYEGKDFYYKGTGVSTEVTTTADTIVDYVPNNLQFRTSDNGDNWMAVQDVVNTEGLNNTLSEVVTKYNTIIKTEKFKDNKLKTGESATKSLVLTQSITPQNADDDLTYDNIAEITKISNTVGRKMAFSIQGNQNPKENPTEVDSYRAESVKILPPFGIGNIVVYVAIAITTLAVLVVGIIFIKKKVLKK